MPRYKLGWPAFIVANGHTKPQYFRAGAIVDFDGLPTVKMVPLDDAAKAAFLKRHGPPRPPRPDRRTPPNRTAQGHYRIARAFKSNQNLTTEQIWPGTRTSILMP